MNYDEIAAEYEKKPAWQDWQSASEKEVLQMRLTALRYREAELRRETTKIEQEADLLDDLLIAM